VGSESPAVLGPVAIQSDAEGHATEVSPEAPVELNRCTQVEPPSLDWRNSAPTATQSVELAQATSRSGPRFGGTDGAGCQVAPVFAEFTMTGPGAKFDDALCPTARH